MSRRTLLVLDASFSYEAILERELQASVTCRDLDGFFEHVWSVHPFASLVTSVHWGSKFGVPCVFRLSASHTFIEGKVGCSPLLEKFPSVNFFLSQLGVLCFLVWLIRKEKISVIRVGDPLYLGFLGYVISKIARIPYLVRVGANNEKIRSTTGSRIMPRLFGTMNQERLVERLVLSNADMVAAANDDNLQFALSSGARVDKCTLFRYGNLIDAAHFVEPALRPVPLGDFPSSPFLLCIARLELVKKVDDVIRVMAAVKTRGFKGKVLVVGDGRERKNLENFAKQLGVSEDVVFCGNRDQSWLASVIPRAQVVLSPHTGRALAEAALGGAPIVAYDIDWQPELVESGVTGEIVPFGDWQQFSRCVTKLLGDKVYSRSVGQNAREKALEMMDPGRLNAHERQQYDLLISTRTARA